MVPLKLKQSCGLSLNRWRTPSGLALLEDKARKEPNYLEKNTMVLTVTHLVAVLLRPRQSSIVRSVWQSAREAAVELTTIKVQLDVVIIKRLNIFYRTVEIDSHHPLQRAFQQPFPINAGKPKSHSQIFTIVFEIYVQKVWPFNAVSET